MLRKREREIKRTLFLHSTEQLPFHFAPAEDSRTEQVSFYLSFNFQLQFTNKSKGFPPGGALGYFLGGYVPPGTPNWHPVLKTIFPKIDTPF